jgi:hypothetical protein
MRTGTFDSTFEDNAAWRGSHSTSFSWFWMKGSTMSTNEPEESPVPRPRSEIGNTDETSKRGPDSERADQNDDDCRPEGAPGAEKTSLCVEVEIVRDPTAEHPS